MRVCPLGAFRQNRLECADPTEIRREVGGAMMEGKNVERKNRKRGKDEGNKEEGRSKTTTPPL